MNRKEINFMDMITAVIVFLTDHLPFFDGKPGILEVKAAIEANVGEIEDLNKMQADSPKTNAEVKKKVRTDAITAAMKVAGGLSAHAAITKDLHLKSLAVVSGSALKGQRDSDFVITLMSIYDAALPLADELAVWGVTLEDINALKSYSDEYKQYSPALRNVKINSKQVTADMKAKIMETNLLIRESLDPLMLPFRQLNPSLHSKYISARTVIGRAATRPKPVEKPTES